MAETNGSPDPASDTRFCYGANCTWFGPIQDVSDTAKFKVKDKAEHFPALMSDHALPCCPCCGGMLFELQTPEDFWNAIKAFEIGEYPAQPQGGKPRPHPGYQKMWEWQRDQKTCFETVDRLAASFTSATGTAVDLAP